MSDPASEDAPSAVAHTQAELGTPAAEPGAPAPTPEHTIEHTDGPRGELGARLARGTTIRRYVVLDEIGAGGMGVVYAAYDYGLDRRIALKLVRDRGGATARARLMREAQALAKLSHPNVVAVYDVGEHDGEIYVAMELVEHGGASASLRAWLAAAPRPWREILALFLRAGAGLAAAHAVGIVHRDIKPDNLLVDRSGAIRVGDFGLALVAHHIDEAAAPVRDATATATGAVLGTPAYMAPEQHDGADVDARADQFAFCVALYEALYGVRPFAGESSTTLRAQIAAGALAAPTTGHDVPGWVRRAVGRGLAADPAARFPSMIALLEALDDAPRARRRWWAIGAVALVGVVGALAWPRGATAMCGADPTRFAGAWDGPRRAAMQAAFAHSGAPDAADTWDRVAQALDGRVRDWQAMRTEACEATHARGEQSAALLDVRMACLDDRAAELRALSDALSTADRPQVGHALDAVRGLPKLEACTRSAALHRGQRARDPLAPVRRAQWAQIQATALVGDRPRALAQSQALASDARASGDRAIEAEAERSVGRLLTFKGDAAGAEPALYAAIAAGQAAGDDELVARAWFDLAWLVSEEGAHHAQAHQFIRLAQGAIDRLGGAPALQAILEDRLGVLFYDQGKYAEAAPHLERGLALREQLYGPTSGELAASLQHLAMQRTAEDKKAEALALHHRAYEIAAAAYGPTHPDTLGCLNGEAVASFELGRDDDALALLQRALDGTLHNDPDDARNASELLNNISVIQRKRNDLAGARASQERAIALISRVAGEDSPSLAAQLSNLALILADQGEHAAALAAAQRGVDIQTRAVGAEHPDVAEALSTLGNVQMAAHRPAEAIAPLERAIAIRAPIAGAASSVADDRFRLARALDDAHRDRARALALATAARATFVTDDNTEQVQAVDAWRARR